MSTKRITTTAVLELQSLSRLRWQLMLGLPRLASLVESELRTLARHDRTLGRALSEWVRSCVTPVPLAQHARRTRRLADAARQADAFGDAGLAILRRTTERLSGDESVAALAHLQTVVTTSDRYLETRNDLVVRGGSLIDRIIVDEGVPLEHRRDAFQDGVLGLMQALESFSVREHASFELHARRVVASFIKGERDAARVETGITSSTPARMPRPTVRVPHALEASAGRRA